jgi:hypothetical protein
VIEVVGGAQPTAPLRLRYQYNNVMYGAAGEMVAAAQESPYEEVIQDLIFAPLGMRSSLFSVTVMQERDDFSRGYLYDRETKKARLLPMRDMTSIAAAGGINSSARDMARWVRLMLGEGALEGQRLVSEKSFHALVSPQTAIEGGVSYGFGWVLASWRDHRTITHGGGIDGFRSLVDMIPDLNLGFVILANDQGAPLEGPFTDIIYSNLAGDRAKPAESMGTGHPLSESAARELCGFYRSAGFIVRISTAGGKIALVAPGQPAYPLVEKSQDDLASTALPAGFEVTVKRDAGGKISGIAIRQPQGMLELARAAEYSGALFDELLTKAIAAAGGETSLRRHRSEVITGDIDFVSQGMKGEIRYSFQAPNAFSFRTIFQALGKSVGWTHDCFDGTAGATESSFGPLETWGAGRIRDARAQHDFSPLLDVRTLFKDMAIIGVENVNGENAYVVILTPEAGNPITVYYSTSSFRPLRRDMLQGTVRPTTLSELYSDFRDVDGEMVPFRIVQSLPGGSTVVITVRDVKFNVDIPQSTFKPR